MGRGGGAWGTSNQAGEDESATGNVVRFEMPDVDTHSITNQFFALMAPLKKLETEYQKSIDSNAALQAQIKSVQSDLNLAQETREESSDQVSQLEIQVVETGERLHEALDQIAESLLSSV